MRVLLDTNVLVSAYATRGLCEDVMRLVLAEHEMLVAEVVLAEFERVLREKLGVPASLVDQASVLLRAQTIVPRPARPAPVDIADSDDAWVLASAIEGGADIVVTGDRDLLDIAEQAPVSITDPRGFWTRMKGG